MPRQIIDLRTQAQRQGITRRQQTMQSIAGILHTAGQAEQKRRDRQTLDRIARAISQGATTVEAIAAASREEPQFATGIPGMLQKIGGMFQPSPGGIKQNIIGQALQQALVSPLQRAQIKSTRALTRQRRAQAKAEPNTALRRRAEIYLRLSEVAKQQAIYIEDDNKRAREFDKSIKYRQQAEEILKEIGEILPGQQPIEPEKPILPPDKIPVEKVVGLPGESEEETRERLGMMPKAPRPELEEIWSKLSDEQKSKVTCALMNRATTEEIKAALKLEGIE